MRTDGLLPGKVPEGVIWGTAADLQRVFVVPSAPIGKAGDGSLPVLAAGAVGKGRVKGGCWVGGMWLLSHLGSLSCVTGDAGDIEIPVLRQGPDLSSPTSVWCATRTSDPPSASPGVDYIPTSRKIEFRPGKTEEVRSHFDP